MPRRTREQLEDKIADLEEAIRMIHEEKRMWRSKALQFEADFRRAEQALARILHRNQELIGEIEADVPSLSVDLRPTTTIGGVEVTYDPSRD